MDKKGWTKKRYCMHFALSFCSPLWLMQQVWIGRAFGNDFSPFGLLINNQNFVYWTVFLSRSMPLPLQNCTKLYHMFNYYFMQTKLQNSQHLICQLFWAMFFCLISYNDNSYCMIFFMSAIDWYEWCKTHILTFWTMGRPANGKSKKVDEKSCILNSYFSHNKLLFLHLTR